LNPRVSSRSRCASLASYSVRSRATVHASSGKRGPMRHLVVVVLLAVSTFATGFGCDSKKESTGNGIAAIASGSLAMQRPAASVIPAAAAAPAPGKKVVRRPSAEEALMATDVIRARLENRHPEAAGFLTGDQVEEKLFALELKRGKDDEALKHLDRIAKGKWLLLTGPLTPAQPEGFELPVRYTPRDSADPMGLTSQWINVKVTNLQGYDAAEYRAGEKTAVLARYNGNKEASPGFDLILLGQWYE
jgi:hypothetical protein